MHAGNTIATLPQGATIESGLNVRAGRDSNTPVSPSYRGAPGPIEPNEEDSRLRHNSDFETRVGPDDQSGDDLAFLKPKPVAPLAIRLVLALAEAVRDIRQDPVAFIGATAESGPLPQKKRSRTAAGIAVAIVVYTLAFTAVYASYSFHNRRNPSVGGADRLEVTLLASPPTPVKKAVPVLEHAGGGIGKSQLTAPAGLPEPPKADLIRTEPAPRHLDEKQTRVDPNTRVPAVAFETYSPANETASAIPSSGGSGSSAGKGNGVGAGSDAGQGAVGSTAVNYNEVFSVSAVTTRPQILARPVPGYTEEARHAQVEGAVRLSVVLDTNGTVSDIRVARGLGYGLDEKAIEAARQLRFVPAQKDGHKVSVRVLLEFKFSLL